MYGIQDTEPMTVMEKITLLIVDDIPETRDNLRKLLYFESDIDIAGLASNGREAIQAARSLQPNIVLMDINMPDMDGIAASEEISRVAPMTQVIMMSVQSEADYLRRSMLAGAMDFLTKPFTSEELVSSIRRVYSMGASRRAVMPPQLMEADKPTGPTVSGRRPPPGGKILLIYSPKGGTGCSTVATNLAIALQQLTSKKVALVDASLQFGDVGVLLNLQGNRTIAHATAKIESLDAQMLSAIMSPHASGIHVLAAPDAPEVAETITADCLKSLLTTMRNSFDYILMDTWSYLDDIVLTSMDVADRILLVITPEIPSIKSTKQFFEVAEALKYPPEQIDLILNKVIPRNGIRAEQLENSMKHKVSAQIDFDPKAIRQAINQGLPLAMSEPGHPISQGFVTLARQELAHLEPQALPEKEAESVPQEPARKRRTGLFGRLKR
jgi:pilus assembly protein CpaE